MPPGWTDTRRMSWRRWMRSWATTASWRPTGLLHSAASLSRQCWAASRHRVRGGRRHRRKRLAELQRARGRIQFGSVQPIMRTDFVQEVSVASDGCWVVVHLYKDGCAAFCWPGKGGRSARPPCAPDLGGAHRLGPSELLGLCLDELAFKYPATKFVKIMSTECIPSYPDRNLPTVLLYHASQCVRTLAGLGAFGGLRVTPNSAGPLVTQGSTGGCALWCARLKLQRCAGVAAALNAAGPVCAAPDDQPHGKGQAP